VPLESGYLQHLNQV
jgi:RNase P subunit RPR2